MHQTRDTLTLQFAGSAAIQSSMSTLNPLALTLDYTRMMMGFLLFDPDPARIVMIGLGGGAVPKFCHRYLPDAVIDVAEIDPDVIALRDAFKVPPDDARFQVRLADGREYVVQTPPTVDVLLIDAFDGLGMPPDLCTAAFFEACHACLTANGILVVNLHLESDTYAICLDHLREQFGATLFEVLDDDMTNSVVFACKGSRFEGTDLRQALRKPPRMAKDAWRQLMPTFKVIEATLTPR